MAKGDLFKNSFTDRLDSYTGRIVTRLTSGEYLSHHPYFYNKMVTKDNKKLLYASKRDHYRNLYLMDLTDGLTLQLTDDRDIRDFDCCLSQDDKYVIYSKASKVIRLNLTSLEEDVIYETPHGWMGCGNMGISSDSRYLVIVEMDVRDKVDDSKGDFSAFMPQWECRPRCRILHIDINKKKGSVIYEEKYWLGHPQIRPGDNGTILFCHEGPWHEVDARMWLMNSDGTGLRCAKKKKAQGEMAGHEYWLCDGSRIAYTFFPGEYGVDATIRFINPDTLEEEIFMKSSGYSHFISNFDNSFIVGDTQPPAEPFLYIVDVRKKEEKRLCWHGSSFKGYGNNQDSHVHPAFSNDGSMVIFTSDWEGVPCIYRTYL